MTTYDGASKTGIPAKHRGPSYRNAKRKSHFASHDNGTEYKSLLILYESVNV